MNLFKILKIIFWSFSLFLLNPTVMAQNLLEISQFSKVQDLTDWQKKSFKGQTSYQTVKEKNKIILMAKSQSSASGLFKEIKVDLTKTPYLNWSWKISNQLTGLNETQKSGDDYAARLYLVKKSKYLVWKTKVLNYAWSSNQKQNSQWDNAYASQAKMIAVKGKEAPTKQWFTEKRNVLADFKQAFGEDITSVDVVAIMTDTDDSKQAATAYYGAIYFSQN